MSSDIQANSSSSHVLGADLPFAIEAQTTPPPAPSRPPPLPPSAETKTADRWSLRVADARVKNLLGIPYLFGKRVAARRLPDDVMDTGDEAYELASRFSSRGRLSSETQNSAPLHASSRRVPPAEGAREATPQARTLSNAEDKHRMVEEMIAFSRMRDEVGGEQYEMASIAAVLQKEVTRIDPGGVPPEVPAPVTPPPEHHLPEHRVATLDGAGFALSEGRLYSWNNGTGSWDRLKKGIASIRLGADGHAYARSGEGELLRLTGPTPSLPLKAGDVFCVSPTGRVATLARAAEVAPQAQGSNDAPTAAQAAHVEVTSPSKDGAAVATLTLPVPEGEARALAFDSDGGLHLLAVDGNVFKLRQVPNPGSPHEDWTRLDVPAGMRFTSLLTLPNGTVSGADGHGKTHMLEKNGTWTAFERDTATGLQRTYGQFRDSRQKFTNTTLGSPLTPGTARSDKKGLNWYQSKLSVFEPEQMLQLVPRGSAILNMAKERADLLTRYMSYFKAHYLPADSPQMPAAPSPLAQLRQEYADLIEMAPAPQPPPPSDDEICTAMHTNAVLALDRIERALGMTDEQGDLKPVWRLSAGLRAAQPQAGATLHSADNILHTLLQRREQFLPKGHDADPIIRSTTLRLRRLLRAGVYVQRPLPPRPSREAAGFRALPARMFDGAADFLNEMRAAESLGLDILVGQLVKDQLAYERSLQADTVEKRKACLDRLTGADGNQIAQRFKLNIWDARSEVAFDAMRNILAGFAQPDHVLNRAARFQGMLGEDKHHEYVRLVEELPPGEHIRFEYTVGGGLDGSGWSHNFTPADRFKEGAHPKVDKPSDLKGRFNIALNKVPNITPVPSASVGRTRAMTISKRSDGVDITFSNAFDSEVKLLCAKIKWSAGESAANHRLDKTGKDSRSALGLVLFGLEMVPAALVFNHGKEDSVTLSINDNEDGVSSRVVHQLLEGTITPEQLIELTADAAYTRSSYSQWSNTLDVQALIAVVGIFTSPDKLSDRLKAVGAFVAQLTGSLNWSKSASTTQDASGITKSATGYDGMTALNGKFINVTELHGSKIFKLPAFSTLIGRTKGISIPDGYEMDHTLPTWIDLQIMEMVPSKTLYRTPTVRQASDGTVTGMKFVLTSKDVVNFEKMPHWDEIEKHSPEIAANLRGAAEKASAQGLPVEIEMELMPEPLTLVSLACRHDTAQLSKEVDKVMRDRKSWRIKQLQVSGRAQYSTALVAGASLFRYRSQGSNIHQSNLALIEITYADESGHPETPLHAVVRGPLTNGGGQPRFDQLDALAGSELGELVYEIKEEGRNGLRRRLAELPALAPDESKLAELSNTWLCVPKDEPHLALDKGEPVVQYPEGRKWKLVPLDDADIGRLLEVLKEENNGGIPPAALLQLMQAGASGQLKQNNGGIPPAALLLLVQARTSGQLATQIETRDIPTQPDMGFARQWPIGIVGLLANAQALKRAIEGNGLDRAQTLVLKTFFGEKWPDLAPEVASKPEMVAALEHALRQQGDEALADSALHDTPVAVIRERTSMSTMMTTGSLPSASLGGGG